MGSSNSVQQLGYHPAVSSTFSPDDVQRLASLARLELSPEEIALFARQLSDILAFADEVQAVDTTSVNLESSAAPSGGLRDDVRLPSLDRDEALRGATGADRADGLFTVPRVFAE
jgi:aspartyl-tRNA(Asn)/glutamyl-tRNA(Gln) amidotransferase subunit C